MPMSQGHLRGGCNVRFSPPWPHGHVRSRSVVLVDLLQEFIRANADLNSRNWNRLGSGPGSSSCYMCRLASRRNPGWCPVLRDSMDNFGLSTGRCTGQAWPSPGPGGAQVYLRVGCLHSSPAQWSLFRRYRHDSTSVFAS